MTAAALTFVVLGAGVAATAAAAPTTGSWRGSVSTSDGRRAVTFRIVRQGDRYELRDVSAVLVQRCATDDASRPTTRRLRLHVPRVLVSNDGTFAGESRGSYAAGRVVRGRVRGRIFRQPDHLQCTGFEGRFRATPR